MSHFYQVVGVGTPGPAGASSGAETVRWAGARFPKALWASLRRLDLRGGGQHCLHLGCRKFVKQCVRKTGLPPNNEMGWSLRRPGAVRRNRSGGLAGISTAGRAWWQLPVALKGVSPGWRLQPGARRRGERPQPLWGGVARG